jgi:hypothetical protein
MEREDPWDENDRNLHPGLPCRPTYDGGWRRTSRRRGETQPSMKSLPPARFRSEDGQVKGQRHGRDKRFGVTSGRFRTLSPMRGTHRGISYACGFDAPAVPVIS